MSTFQGLELSKRALFAQQSALYTTGHNISNVNTNGYSRQRVEFNATNSFPVPSRVMPNIPGQLGTGVEAGIVERIRNHFLDTQYRSETSRHEYWNTKQDGLERLESLLNEPSDSGLSKTMDQFWQSLQDLSKDPEDGGTRSVVGERGLALAETFNYLSKSMQSIQGDLKEQIDGSVKDVNALLRNINNLNEQIKKVEPHGLLPNDLYDERDRLIDRLSEEMNIKVHYEESSDSALDVAVGIASIELLDESGQSIGEDGVYLIDAKNNPLENAVNELKVSYKENDDGSDYAQDIVSSISVEGYDDLEELELQDSIGRLSALVELYGFENADGEIEGVYPETLDELNKMAKEFAGRFNEVHEEGIDANGENGVAFFVTKDGSEEITAENLTINKDILKNGNLIAAGVEGKGSRNGDNALNLKEVFNEDIEALNNGSTRKFYTSLIGDLAVETEEAIKMTENTASLRNQVDESRMSVSAVSLDEEISNLVKFQHAYNASARNMTAVDEMLERIINNMGIVGR